MAGAGIKVEAKLQTRAWNSQEKKRIIKDFLEFGHTNHSGNASTIGVIIEYLEENNICYTLKATPKFGYWLEIDHEATEKMKPLYEGMQK